MKILIACEYSGIVREAFAAKGHEAWSCDLLDTEIPGNHYKGDVLDIINDGWDLMIAHPPCVYLSNAGAKHLFRYKKLNADRYGKGLEAKRFFMELWNAPIERICIENPTPSTIYDLPKCTQVIQPYYFGEPYTKRTCLWLKNLPGLTYRIDRNIIPENTKIPGNWFNKGGKDRQKNRAKTFRGIAEAMARQWGTENLIYSETELTLFARGVKMEDNYIAQRPSMFGISDESIIAEYTEKNKLSAEWHGLTTYDMVQCGYPYPDHGEMVPRCFSGTDDNGNLLPGDGMWVKFEDVKSLLQKKSVDR